MRKIVSVLLLWAALCWAAAVQAAQVTAVHWGVDKDNVLRIVVDLDALTTYQVGLSSSAIDLTVDASAQSSALGTQKVKSTLAASLETVAAGGKVTVRLPLLHQIEDGAYKSFTLKQDPVTKRPARIVLDITADKQTRTGPTTASNPKPAASAPKPAAVQPVPKTASPSGSKAKVAAAEGGVVISNKPTKGSGTTGTGASTTAPAKTTPQPKTQPKQETAKPQTSPATVKKAEAPTVPAKGKAKAEKGSGKFATSGGIKDKKITIDPGHGGSDPGAIGAKGTKEKDITLKIAKELQEQLKKKKAKVSMTRTADKDVHGPYASDVDELQARVNVAERNDADVFISIHINSSVNAKVKGFSTYYYPKSSHDKRLATAVHNKLTKNFGRDNLGVREANFYVTKRSSMPAILIELCFISNKDEEKLLQSSWFQKKAARLLAEAMEDYFK